MGRTLTPRQLRAVFAAGRAFTALVTGRPGQALLRGLNLARRGRLRPARTDLESVARGTGEDAWRILAYQELAQLDPEAGDPRAVAVLDEALGVFPDDQGLRLLARFHGRPVEPLLGDVPPSPRLRYETVREAELAVAEKTWTVEVEDRLGGLSSTLAELRRRVERGEMTGRAFKPCGDVERFGSVRIPKVTRVPENERQRPRTARPRFQSGERRK